MNNNLLTSLQLPQDIKNLSIDEEKELCHEVREKIISTVSKNGGHLSSNLGVVELTVAIHRVFDSPNDKIIFDVGHQCYTHKILTGRYNAFDTLRRKDGISGFPKPKESEHDPVICGHSSTSVSAALGIAQAMKLQGDNHHVVAVIGDGALTGGLSYEGLNNAGRSRTNLVVIVNYNEMSISKNIGGIAEHLSKLRIKKSYKKAKNFTKKVISHIPFFGKRLKDSISLFKDVIKGKLLHSTLFEDLGFEFIGPIDGHDLLAVEDALNAAKALYAPVIVQVNTVKGKGYNPAEENPGNFHSVSSFDVKSGKTPVQEHGFPQEFGKLLVKAARKDEKICAITAAMKYATGLAEFSKAYPERFFDVGIAEEHAVTFAAGLSKMGMIPVFSVYSSFLQRSYDQLIHDVSIAGLHVVIFECSAGIVGRDGETHQGLFDIPFLTTIPNVTVYSPSCYKELDICLNKALYYDDGLIIIRCPKGGEILSEGISQDYSLTVRDGDLLIVSYGRESGAADNVSCKLGFDHLKLLKVFPISEDVVDIINCYKKAYIFEECSYEGSIGQKLKACCKSLRARAINGYVQHMSIEEAIDMCGLSEKKIAELISEDGNAKT